MCVSHSLSLPHANVWFSLSAREERRWYNDTVTPILHLLPFLSLHCSSADALHALVHRLQLSCHINSIHRKEDKEVWSIIVLHGLCKHGTIPSFYGFYHRDTDAHDSPGYLSGTANHKVLSPSCYFACFCHSGILPLLLTALQSVGWRNTWVYYIIVNNTCNTIDQQKHKIEVSSMKKHWR